MTKVLALDQSSKVTGWAIFEDGKLVKNGKFSYTDTNPIRRINRLRKDVQALIISEEIQKVIMEDIQLQNGNVTTLKILAFVLGGLETLCEDNDYPYEVMSSSTWKSVCKVKGSSRPEQKRNAQIFVEETYGIKPIQDIVDAVCIGHAATMDARALNWG